jgi:predicted O-methyltransferase YrrM
MNLTSLPEAVTTWGRSFFAVKALPPQRSTEELVDFCMTQPFAPIQVRSELLAFAQEIAARQPKGAMEIGTYWGGTLFLLCRLAHDDARIISLDQHQGTLWGARKMIYYSFLKKRQRLHIVIGDSHGTQTHARVAQKVGSEKLDLLFIDGDHSYEGVKSDFDMYSPFVRSGGLVAFHDILSPHVCDYWGEVKSHYRHKEIVDDPNQKWAGIGLLYV